MCLLIETIKINEGYTENISWHNKRFNASRLEIFGIETKSDLEMKIKIPDEFKNGIVKCRIGYGKEINFIKFEPYKHHDIRTLQLVFDDLIRYDYKYHDRTQIAELFTKRKGKDDIIIVKNDLIRESSYCNLVFSDGKELFTPSSPLLKGSKRAKYLFEGKIREKEIRVEDLNQYQEIHLINAFLDLYNSVIPVKNIFI